VKRIEAHKSAVNEISFDEAVEYIASCSDDGTVVVGASYLRISVNFSTAINLTRLCSQIQGFYTEETATFKYKRPMKVCCVLVYQST
jgi:hypothetical protein